MSLNTRFTSNEVGTRIFLRSQPGSRDMQVVSQVLTEDVITVEEARNKLSKLFRKRQAKSTLIRWIHTGKLDAVRLGRQWFTSSQALTRFIESQTGRK